MPYLYMVRCNFRGTPDEEAEWNAWYEGPKTKMMLGMPHFLSGQRFRAVGLDDAVRYLALWQVDGPQAFETPEYTGQWGFADWSDRIVDWSRNLLEASSPAVATFPAGGRVVVTAYDEDPGPGAARGGAVRLRAVGLDEVWPVVTVEVLAPGEAPEHEAERAAGVAWRTLFEPLAPARSV
jgi:hypothetical protein